MKQASPSSPFLLFLATQCFLSCASGVTGKGPVLRVPVAGHTSERARSARPGGWWRTLVHSVDSALCGDVLLLHSSSHAPVFTHSEDEEGACSLGTCMGGISLIFSSAIHGTNHTAGILAAPARRAACALLSAAFTTAGFCVTLRSWFLQLVQNSKT